MTDEIIVELTYKKLDTVTHRDSSGCHALREFKKDESGLPPYIGIPVGKDCEGHDHVYVSIDPMFADAWIEELRLMAHGASESQSYDHAVMMEGDILDILTLADR